MLLPLLAVLAVAAAPPSDLPRLKAEAANVSIIRDDWGVAHVHGKTDADAVFGMAYAQAEDDFSRIEANYLTALGRTAEAADAKPDAHLGRPAPAPLRRSGGLEGPLRRLARLS